MHEAIFVLIRVSEDYTLSIQAIILQATPDSHDEGSLVHTFLCVSELFLSFGESLSYGKLLL